MNNHSRMIRNEWFYEQSDCVMDVLMICGIFVIILAGTKIKNLSDHPSWHSLIVRPSKTQSQIVKSRFEEPSPLSANTLWSFWIGILRGKCQRDQTASAGLTVWCADNALQTLCAKQQMLIWMSFYAFDVASLFYFQMDFYTKRKHHHADHIKSREKGLHGNIRAIQVTMNLQLE